MRKFRRTKEVRDMSAETRLSVKDLIMPYFVIAGKNKKEPINSLPGIYRLSIDGLIKDVRVIRRLGIRRVLLFGLARRKDASGAESYSPGGAIQQAAQAIKESVKDITVITDVCLCGYTTHGHCGIVKKSQVTSHKSQAQSKIHNYCIDNDVTIKILAKIALSHARAGADFVAPSAMMDGQVQTIRGELDKNNFKRTKILAYSAKYSSNFYGPFREALNSRPQFGDRKTYQMDFRNSDEALREIGQDIKEGADMVMVKPALAYLDIIRRAKDNFRIPLAAYNVSGEYALVKNYCRDKETEKNLALEILTAIRRAGADSIITYHAKDAAKWLAG